MALTHDVQRRRFTHVRTPVGAPEARRIDPRDLEGHCSSEPPTAFATILDALVRERGLSNLKLAGLAELDHSFISRLRTGDRLPSRGAVLAIAEALGLDDCDRDRLLISAQFWPWEMPDDATLIVMRQLMEGIR